MTRGATARDRRICGSPRLGQRGHDVLVERLARSARLLRAIEHRDRAHRRRERRHEGVGGEGPEEPHLHEPHGLTTRGERLDRLLGCAHARAHQHEDPLGLRVTHVVEQPVGPAGPGGEAIHRVLHDVRHRRVERAGGFPSLEEDVRVLRRSPKARVLRRQGALPVGADQVVVDQGAQVVVVERADLRHFVRRSEPVEEVEEGDAAPERRGVCDQRQIMRLLHRGGAEHREARAPRRHHVRVIAEDRQCVRGEGPGGDVHHEGRQLTRDLVHVRDHQQQTLRGGEGRGERPGGERAVQRPGGAALALHLDHLRHGAPQVRDLRRGPRVRQLTHRR